MFFLLGLSLFLFGAQLVHWLRSHTVYEHAWQECPICKGSGKTPNKDTLPCMTCLGFGGWAYTTRRWLSRRRYTNRPFD